MTILYDLFVHLEIGSGRLATGQLDGFPGPTFVPQDELAVPDLVVITDASGMRCSYAGRDYVIPTRRR